MAILNSNLDKKPHPKASLLGLYGQKWFREKQFLLMQFDILKAVIDGSEIIRIFS